MALKLATKFHVKINLQELSTKFLPVYGENGINLHDWLNSNISLSGTKHILDTTDLLALEVDGGATIHKNLQVDNSIVANGNVTCNTANVLTTLTLENTTDPPLVIMNDQMIPNLNAEKVGNHTIEEIYAIAFFWGG